MSLKNFLVLPHDTKNITKQCVLWWKVRGLLHAVQTSNACHFGCWVFRRSSYFILPILLKGKRLWSEEVNAIVMTNAWVPFLHGVYILMCLDGDLKSVTYAWISISVTKAKHVMMCFKDYKLITRCQWVVTSAAVVRVSSFLDHDSDAFTSRIALIKIPAPYDIYFEQDAKEVVFLECSLI